MLASVKSASLLGIEAFITNVEIDVSSGLPSFSVVGLPDTAIRESRNRIKSAIKNSGYPFPDTRITANLSPAGLKKEGAGFDLPIALGILAAKGIIDLNTLEKFIISGELSLDGKLRPIRGALAIALNIKKESNLFILPKRNASEVSSLNGAKAFGFQDVKEVVNFLNGVEQKLPEKQESRHNPIRRNKYNIDFSDVKGQEHVKRGMEVAACGGHNVLLIGPPGSGKSMLAKRLPTILSEMTQEESVETTVVYSAAGLHKGRDIIGKRPFRSPHHSISDAALVGGGSWPTPGEISLAHNGVLFLDEFPEFKRNVLELLRQPLENGNIIVSRVEQTVCFPARFVLVAAMNPCPCGYFTDPKKECHCTPHQIQRYLSKISGPLLDRIDIHIEVPRIKYEDLSGRRNGEPSEAIRKRVCKTIAIQKKRYKKERIYFNSCLEPKEMEKYCILSKESKEILKMAILELGLSARAYDKILKISRTISDMEASEIIQVHHVSEAIGYRSLDRNLWG